MNPDFVATVVDVWRSLGINYNRRMLHTATEMWTDVVNTIDRPFKECLDPPMQATVLGAVLYGADTLYDLIHWSYDRTRA